jgi:hypothetical protein
MKIQQTTLDMLRRKLKKIFCAKNFFQLSTQHVQIKFLNFPATH